MTKTGNFYYGESIELDAKLLRLPYKVTEKDRSTIDINHFHDFRKKITKNVQ